jgi:hypothetical protein
MRPVPFGPFALALVLAPAAAAAPPESGGRYALVVGVGNYDPDELRALKYADRDAESLAEVLRDAGYARVVLMTAVEGAKKQRLSPTGENIREELKGLLENRRPEDTVLVAFAGHGVQFISQSEHYFCPSNARLRDPKTLIPLTEVYNQLKGCDAGTKILLVDACRNDPESDRSLGTGTRLASVTRPQALKPPGGVAALFSCSAGQKAYESDELKHGVFFHFVIQGLRGKAAEDGAVDLDGLARYVRHKVPDYVKDDVGPRADQVPYEVRDGSGDFRLIGPPAGTQGRQTSRPVEPAGMFRPLFNGKDLSGWKVASGRSATWSVADGNLIQSGGGGQNDAGWLLTERSYRDFVLRLEFTVSSGANSGVGLHCSPTDRNQLEIQILDDDHPDYRRLPASSLGAGDRPAGQTEAERRVEPHGDRAAGR